MFKLGGSKMLFPFLTLLESSERPQIILVGERCGFDERLLFCDPMSKLCVVSRIGLNEGYNI